MTPNTRKPDHQNAGTRPRLTLERVVERAVELADQVGIQKLTMRALARALGVEAMSLYYYVANKDALLDRMIDLVFAEIELPPGSGDWRTELHERAHSARAALVRHPWAVGLMDSRSAPGPATLRHHDAVLGCLRAGGFSVVAAAHAYSLLDSYIYGFVLQELSLPFDASQGAASVAADVLALMPSGAYPHLEAVAREHMLKPGYSYADEFEVGLGLVLDALERLQGAP